MSANPRDPWALLAARTPARIAIGRAGPALPTREVLAFALAHARARDAVQARLDWTALAERLGGLGLSTIQVASEARDRATYLRRPDLGRQLDGDSRARLEAAAAGTTCDLAILIGDGLSATAVAAQAPALVEALLPHVARLRLSLGPVVLAESARVALGDDVGALLRARLVAVLIGERPGLSAADGLGVYLTFDPKPGRTDAERNCISNIRAGGLVPSAAATNLAWLIEASCAMRATGVRLKDRSDGGQLTTLPQDLQ
ncbi:MAG: ethanolamine ammonia-lyase subunit EutC [Hyphomicrobiaceae bacterium]|nr:ethanolamine ammonia-lyase subunit EutC [Hyphomicrobiaceae bacterium]